MFKYKTNSKQQKIITTQILTSENLSTNITTIGISKMSYSQGKENEALS